MEAGETQETELEEDAHYPLIYVLFSAPISHDSAEALLLRMGQCAGTADEVRLLLSTTGGDVSAGINLYNVLRGMPYRLVTQNTGDVASIGVAVYLAGEERLTCPNTVFLTHGVTSTPPPGQPLDAKWLSERHEAILKDEARINDLLADRTSLKAEELAKSSEEEQKYDAESAVGVGIAHRIADVEIPDDTPVLTVLTR